MLGGLGGPQQPVDALDRREAALRSQLAFVESQQQESLRQFYSWQASQQPVPSLPPAIPPGNVDVVMQELVQRHGANPGALQGMRDSINQAVGHLGFEAARQFVHSLVSEPQMARIVFPAPSPPPGSVEATAAPIREARQSFGLSRFGPGEVVSLPAGDGWKSAEVPDGNSMPFRPHVEDPRVEAARYENAARQHLWGGRH
jgi:hypothetical protein